jgi:Uncharacterised nucleotidyltransferase
MPNMAPETEVLLLCARQRMPESCAHRLLKLCGMEKFRWDLLCQAAVSYQIPSLVLTNLLKNGQVAERIPPAIGKHWRNIKIRNILAKKNQARMVGQIVKFFADRSIRVMLVKGAALDVAVYEEPWYTVSADADLLMDKPYVALSKADRAAIVAMVKGWPVEPEFTRHHDLDMNLVLDINYPRLWEDARAVAVEGLQAYIMSPEDMLLAACINLCRKRYQQLKGMVAVREVIQAFPGLNWEKLAGNALECGANWIVYTAITITTLVLGCEVPSQAMNALQVGFARRWTIRNLSCILSSRLFQLPQSPREPAARVLASHLLRIASYRPYQCWREVQGQLTLRRFWKAKAQQAGPASRT